MKWRKSVRSSPNGENCVEVANLPGTVAVRDSKDSLGPMLTFSRSTFRAFVADVKNS